MNSSLRLLRPFLLLPLSLSLQLPVSLASASDHSLALFLDLTGNDAYAALGTTIKGRSGSNTLHFDQSQLFSFSFFMDAAGDDTHTPSPLTPHSAQRTGTINPDAPATSQAWGVTIDR
jgi:hypothetical protein